MPTARLRTSLQNSTGPTPWTDRSAASRRYEKTAGLRSKAGTAKRVTAPTVNAMVRAWVRVRVRVGLGLGLG